MDKQAKLAAAVLTAIAFTVSSCGPSDVPASAPAAVVEPTPVTATYEVATAEAWRVTAAAFPGLGDRGWIQDESDKNCGVRLTDQVSVKVCSAAGKMGQLTITARTTDADISKGIGAISSLISPDAEPADLIRVNAEAERALAKGGWTSLCPDTHCFKASALAGSWQLAADAGAL